MTTLPFLNIIKKKGIPHKMVVIKSVNTISDSLLLDQFDLLQVNDFFFFQGGLLITPSIFSNHVARDIFIIMETAR